MIRNRRISVRSIFVELVLLCSVCVSAPAIAGQTGNPVPVNEVRILARVNGEPVTEREVLRRLEAAHGDLVPHRQNPYRWRRMLEAAIDTELRDRLLLQAAVETGQTVTPEEVARALERSETMLGETRYQAMLDRRGASAAAYQAFLQRRLLIGKYQSELFRAAAPEDATMRRYYEGHRQSFRRPRQARLERYTVTDPETAMSIYRVLKAGGDPGQSVEVGSAKPQWVAVDKLPANVRSVVDSAAPGDVLEPMGDRDRFHVIRLHGIEAERLSTYEEARPRIEASLLANKRRRILDDWFESRRATADIQYFPLRRPD